MTDSPRMQMFRVLMQARAVERTLSGVYRQGGIGSVNLAGDAHVAMVGAASALAQGDMLFGTRRDAVSALARGVSISTFFHQVFGTQSDPALGRGLPGTLVDGSRGISLGDGSAATHLVHAAGFGHAARLRNGQSIALAFFGSAAQANGELHAALNFAAVNQAQVVFVARGPLAGELRIPDIAPAWGIRAVDVEGDDCLAVHDAVAEAREAALDGGGPTVVDARLESDARPVDASVLQKTHELTTEKEGQIRETSWSESQAALKEARATASVPVHTLLHETFSDRPWFL